MKNILITGGGAPGAPGIIKAIKLERKDLTIFSCDVQEETAGKLLADNYFLVPMGTDPNYSGTLLQLCIDHQIDTILPITTRELQPLSKAKEVFQKNGIHILVSDFSQLEIANNKGKLYNHLLQNGIPVPRFNTITTHKQYTATKAYFINNEQRYIVKPCIANGSRGFRIIEQDTNSFDLLFNHKPNSTFIKEKELDTILKNHSFPEIILSEYLPGIEYTVDCLVYEGQIKLVIPRRRDKMNNGISVAGEIENNEEVISYCRDILGSLKLHGPIGIQVKYSATNKPLLVEINPRIQGTTVACIGAGINIPALCFEDFSQVEQSNIEIKWGTKFIRHYSELYFKS